MQRSQNFRQQAGVELVHGQQRAEKAERGLQQSELRERMQAAGRESAQTALASTTQQANLAMGIGARQLSAAHGKVQAQAKSLKEVRAQQVRAQQRAVQQQQRLDTKDWEIGGLREATAHITRQADRADTNLIHADATIAELNQEIWGLQQNARNANKAARGHINMLLAKARAQKLKLELKLQEARTAPILTAQESAEFKPHETQFVQPTLAPQESAESEPVRPRPRLQERRAAAGGPEAPGAGPERPAQRAAPRPRAPRGPAPRGGGGGPIIVQGAGGGGSSSSSGGAAGGAAASGGGARAPDLSKVVEAVKAIAESAKGSSKKKTSEKGISAARRTYTDRRKTKIAELRALKSKRIREFATRTKKLPKAERDKQRREFKKKVEGQFKEMQTRFPTARGLRSVGAIRELTRKLQALKTAK